jgi:hypothetical protein
MKILSVLGSMPGVKEPKPRILSRSYIFNQLESFYVPVRKKGVKVATSTSKTDLNTGKRAVIPILSQGTCTSLLNTLADWDMVQEVPGPAGNRKEKYYRITPSGELVLQLAEIKPRKV